MYVAGSTDNHYKRKTSNVTDTDVLLPDKLNTFFAHFEDNTVPPTWPATKDCGLSFTAADVSKTFKRVNPCKAVGPDGIPSHVLRAWADQLAGGNWTKWLSPRRTHFCRHEVLWETNHRSYYLYLTRYPLQFAYWLNRSKDDAIAIVLPYPIWTSWIPM